MRVLDAKKISYESHNYVDSGAISGTEVAKALGQNPDAVFKTLVTVSKSKKYYVFLGRKRTGSEKGGSLRR